MRLCATSSTTSWCSRRFACFELSLCLLPLCCAARTLRTLHAALALLPLVHRTRRATTAHVTPALALHRSPGPVCGRLERPCTAALDLSVAASSGLAHGRPCPPARGGLHTGRPTTDTSTPPGRKPTNQPTTQVRPPGRKRCCARARNNRDRNPWEINLPSPISETRKVRSCYVARRK